MSDRTNNEYMGNRYGYPGYVPKYSKKRLRDRRWVVYEAAKLTVQKKSWAKTRADYFRWHEEYKPVGIPKQPQNVYKQEWESWNIFLDVEHTFDGYDRKFGQVFDWMDFRDAVRIVQGLGLKSKLEYLTLHKAGGVPKGIPMAPDQLSLWKDKWSSVGWNGFLGKTLLAQIEAIKNVKKIVCVCRTTNNASNVLEIITFNGLMMMEDALESREDLHVIKSYVLEEGDDDLLRRILGVCGTMQGKDTWMFSDVNNFLYELDNSLLIYQKLPE